MEGWEPLAVPPWSLDGPRGANLWVVGVCAPKPDDPGRLVIGAVDAGDAPELICPGRGADLATAERYGDFEARLEYLLPEGSNAGVIPHGRYELQLLDAGHPQAKSQAREPGTGGAAGVPHPSGHLSAYGFAAPDRLPALPAGRWHELSFRFVAPRFAADGDENGERPVRAGDGERHGSLEVRRTPRPDRQAEPRGRDPHRPVRVAGRPRPARRAEPAPPRAGRLRETVIVAGRASFLLLPRGEAGGHVDRQAGQ